MKENQFNTRQLSIVLFVALLGLKLLVLPSMLYQTAGNSGYVTVVIGMILEFISVISIIYLMKKNPNKTFFEVMSETFGKILAVVINVVFFSYFFVRATYIIMETRTFFVETLYEEYNWFVFSVPFLLLMWFVLTKKNKVVGRVYEAFYPILLIILLIIVVTAIFQAKPDSLFPFCERGAGSVFVALFENTFWFGDSIILYAFMGKVKQDKNFSWQILKKYLIVLVLVTAFMVLFYATYENFAGYLKYAAAKMVQYSPRTTNMGRLDWLAICLCSLGLVMHYILMVFALKTDVNSIFGLKQDNKVSVFIILSIISTLSLLLINNLENIISFMREGVVTTILMIIQFVFPPLIAICSLIKGKIKIGKESKLKYAKNN